MHSLEWTVETAMERIHRTEPLFPESLFFHEVKGLLVNMYENARAYNFLESVAKQASEVIERANILRIAILSHASAEAELKAFYENLEELERTVSRIHTSQKQIKEYRRTQIIRYEARRLYFLTNRLLGQRPKNFFLKEDIKVYVEEVQAEYKLQGITSEESVVLNIETNDDYLTHAIVPLVNNAVDHAFPQGYERTERDILIAAGVRNDQYLVVVQDTGKGIDPEILPYIFEGGYTTRKDKKEHGVGLAIVKAFVERNGGKIGVSSQVGKGTNFFFTIPYEEVAAYRYRQK